MSTFADETVVDDVTSLREAIAEAAVSPGHDTIELPAGSYALSQGQLWMSDAGPVTIQAVDGLATIDAQGASRTFFVNSGEVVFENLVITGGASDLGGSILSVGELTMLHCSLTGNSASIHGGAVMVFPGGTLTMTSCMMDHNVSSFAGGAISSIGGTVSLADTTLTDNDAYAGGGVYANAGLLTITDSTLSSNQAHLGGAILEWVGDQGEAAVADVTNSTLSGNSASLGSAVLVVLSTLTMTSSTVYENATMEFGGAIGTLGCTAQLAGSIVAGNTTVAPEVSGPDVYGTVVSAGYNLIGDGTGFTGLDTDQVGAAEHPIDPRLGPLQDNGGPTLTHVPLPGSPTINAGPNEPLVPTDQRHVTRPQGLSSDIGAVEVVRHQAVIAVKPGSDVAPINLKERGLLPVAVLATPTFDVAEIVWADLSTIHLGDPTQLAYSVPLRANLDDVDHDGDLDLILKFDLEELVDSGGVTADSTALSLTGFTADNLEFLGTQPIRIVGTASKK